MASICVNIWERLATNLPMLMWKEYLVNKITSTRPEWKTYPISDQNGQHLYPFLGRNHLKTRFACFTESYKSNSAPVTPATSIPASLEDLRLKRKFAKSTDILKSALSPVEHLSQLKLMRDKSNEQELEVKGEREGKFKGALKAMKRYVCIGLFHSCLSVNSTKGSGLWWWNFSYQVNFHGFLLNFSPVICHQHFWNSQASAYCQL